MSNFAKKALYAVNYTNPIDKKIADIFDQLLMCVGTTLMTIGAGTALYSYFDFVNYVQEKIKEVIIDYNFTDKLSDNQKKDLARKLEKELLHQSTDNNLYDFVQEEVLTLAKQAYYEEFTLNVSCKKDFDIDDTANSSIMTLRNSGSIFIKINSWVLPGDGITFVLSPVQVNKT